MKKTQTKHLNFTSCPSGRDVKTGGHSRRYYKNHKSLKLHEKNENRRIQKIITFSYFTLVLSVHRFLVSRLHSVILNDRMIISYYTRILSREKNNYFLKNEETSYKFDVKKIPSSRTKWSLTDSQWDRKVMIRCIVYHNYTGQHKKFIEPKISDF